jgi:hypothetical protein
MSRLRSHLLSTSSHLAVRHHWIEQARAERTAINGQPQRDQSAGETERRPAAQAGALAVVAKAGGRCGSIRRGHDGATGELTVLGGTSTTP